jgi:hypothetical protein
MNRSLQIFFILLVFLLTLSCISGCTSLRTGDTHNTTVAVQSYNAWVSNQKAFDRELRGSIATIGNHVNTYNAEITKDQPDHSLLLENLAQDRQLLDRWGSDLDKLNAATDRFEEDTTKLSYDKDSEVRTKENLVLTTQYMKIYLVEMGNAREHLIEYVNNAEAYISPDDPDYWNDKYRQNAMISKEQALVSLEEGDAALENVTLQGKQLEKLQ